MLASLGACCWIGIARPRRASPTRPRTRPASTACQTRTCCCSSQTRQHSSRSARGVRLLAPPAIHLPVSMVDNHIINSEMASSAQKLQARLSESQPRTV
jgi:hypothetical protein